MKSLSEQDHYEVLEVRRGASLDEIERSYRLALSTYADDSLAGYSVFGDGDATALRERTEVAYRVLTDRELRRDYDAGLGVAVAGIDESLEALLAAEAPMQPDSPIAELSPIQAPAPVLGFEVLDDGTGDFDGARLRRYRMRCGLELEDIAATTKINSTYLRFIEEEQFADLPSSVYVRGFVTAFASCLGLDSKGVSISYMKRYDEVHPGRRKGRFFESR